MVSVDGVGRTVNSQSVNMCRGRLVRHVNLVVIDSLSPTHSHPAGLRLLFLLNIKP
jgi:hypothetical protein